jgi:polyhydroxybutyrate depolymerase
MRVYRIAVACGTLLACLSLLCGVANGASLTNMEWKVDGTMRRALVHLPASTEGAPIIFAFHGHGGTMN